MPEFAVSATIKAVDKFSSVFGKLGQSLVGQIALGNLVATGIRSIGRGVVELAKSLPEFAERGAQIERTSKIIGISADSYQRLAYAAKMTETPVDAVYGALTKLNKAIGLGERGMGPLIKQVVRLDAPLAMQLRTAKSSDEAFMDVADAVSRTNDKMKQAAIVTAVFGKAGQQMLPMLLLGRKGLEQMKAAAVDVIPDKTLDAAEAFQRNMVRLKANVQEVKDRVLGFGLTLAEKYLPPIMKWLEANKEIIATRLEAFIDRLTTAFDNARPFLAFLLKAAGWLISNWPVLGAVYLGWIAAQIALDAALDANPIGLITLAIQALIVEVLIIIRYWHEITTAVESAWNWFNKLLGNPWIKLGLSLIAEPLLVIAAVIQTIVDLIQGKGISSFRDLIKAAGPLGLVADMLGWSKTGTNAGNIAGEQAPNKGMTPFQFINQVNVDNSRAPGTTSAVRTSQAPTGNPGYQYSGAQ